MTINENTRADETDGKAVVPSSSLRFLLLGSGDRRQQLITEAKKLRPVIEKFGSVVLEDLTHQEKIKVDADFAIVIGGDGSILRSAKQLGDRQIPVIGVNFGKLGFLADVHPADLEKTLLAVASNEFRIVEHLMIRCQVFEGTEMICDELGLNEVAILGGPPYSIHYIDLYVDSEMATTYSCDGLIISTPVGSTAHNLSAGGPILRKNLQAFVISPISPHTLTVRPVVDTADRQLEIIVQNPTEFTSVVMDGQPLCRLTPNHKVQIRKAESQFKMVEVSGQTYYRTLRKKLGWGGEIAKHND
ncbi:MAG: NAD(+)/NADH kinase [Planctomycetota bacterium]|nr:NAD(+)/NADH kinase [Planctomycetota bacterium]